MELELATADGPVRAVWARDAEGALTLALSAPADRRMTRPLDYPAGWETQAFEYLTPDRLVQRTTFANGHVETVDFRRHYAEVIAVAPGNP